ncbi:hypothetical protein [Niabella beijingensis]|uniref:hypothetical protein n=1 Tax=Niabella beijingensis TaxID=2872700 RepID=UPI001CC08C01|nr:hypothetical protein [Niabella beijingensis]MBZ4189490.1 hypothetical protein [Niabella beijingensis]
MNYNDPYKTRCWQGRPIQNPYKVLAACFKYTSIAAYHSSIKNVLLCVEKETIYKKEDPAVVYNRFKAIRSIMLAACTLKNESSPGPQEALMHHSLYCNDAEADEEDLWNSLPRVLTLEEYKDPYSAIRRFFRYQSPQKWKDTLRTILYSAYSSSIDPGELEVLDLYLLLAGLMEAVHLIHVREKDNLQEG